jgi:ComF family protein
MRLPLSKAARALGSGVVELLYPARCFGCGSRVDDAGLCATCEGALRPVRAPFCSSCGEPFDGEIAGTFRCSNCTGREFGFEFARAGYLAAGPVRTMIHDFKYHRRVALRGTLAALAAQAFEDPRIGEEAGWLLVPVPLHPRRRRERGYNQAAEIAAGLSSLRDLPICDALERRRYTPAQANLVRAERLANLAESITLRPSPAARAAIDGARVLLVDDVFTTGATADACARVLRDGGGAEKVVVVTVARG